MYARGGKGAERKISHSTELLPSKNKGSGIQSSKVHRNYPPRVGMRSIWAKSLTDESNCKGNDENRERRWGGGTTYPQVHDKRSECVENGGRRNALPQEKTSHEPPGVGSPGRRIWGLDDGTREGKQE